MTALAFLLSVAYVPMFSTASSPRWIILAAGLPLAASLDPRHLPWGVAVTLAGGMLWGLISLCWSPDPLGGAFNLFQVALLVGVMIAGMELE